MQTTVTVDQCAILVGGLGTRLGTLTATTPKPLLSCGDRPFLAWLMREFLRFGVHEFVLLTGHLSAEIERVAAEIQAALPRDVRVTLSEEPVRAGTGGAVWHARDRLQERFLLCNGDSLFDCGIANLLSAAADDADDVVGRLMLRQLDDASRYGVVALHDDRITAFHERPPSGTPGTINGGVYLFRRSLVDHLQPVCSLEADVLPRLAASGALRGLVGSGYFRDIGIPSDFARAQSEIPARLHRKALFLDRDGVVNIDHGYVGSRDRFDWTEGALDAIRWASNAGWHVFVVTNQSGVARGLYDEEAVHALMDWVADEVRRVGGTIDDWRFCPYHPDAKLDAYRQAHPWRKPQPGMLLDLMQAWELDPVHAVMIGDQDTDLQAAEAAGIQGHLFPGGNLLSFVRPILDKHAGNRFPE
ncbi:MAG: HAD-IIIA family hydrolase [Acetobacteraceae bacterium]|nr:HAD-IIIA family hydrolase [Pseudomonadota bacterium]